MNETAIFLLMVSDGVVKNILAANERLKTSNEINRGFAHMVIKIIEKHPTEGFYFHLCLILQLTAERKCLVCRALVW